MVNEMKIKRALTCSLALNVFLACAIAGGLYEWVAQTRQQVEQQRGLRFAAQALPADRQQQLRQALLRTRRDNQAWVADAHAAKATVMQTLTAPRFDRQALDRALARTRGADTQARAALETTLADFAATLSQEERLKLVGGLQQRGPRNLLPR